MQVLSHDVDLRANLRALLTTIQGGNVSTFFKEMMPTMQSNLDIFLHKYLKYPAIKTMAVGRVKKSKTLNMTL